MSKEISESSSFGRTLSRSRFRALGVGVLVSGAVLFGACGDDDDGDVDLPTTITGSTVTMTEPAKSPTTGSASTPRATGTPGTSNQTPATGGDSVMTIFEDEFSDRPWFTAVEDVDIDGDEVVVTVGAQATSLSDDEIEEMCNEVSQVAFSNALGTKIEKLRVESESGQEVVTATDSGKCTLA